MAASCTARVYSSASCKSRAQTFLKRFVAFDHNADLPAVFAQPNLSPAPCAQIERHAYFTCACAPLNPESAQKLGDHLMLGEYLASDLACRLARCGREETWLTHKLRGLRFEIRGLVKFA